MGMSGIERHLQPLWSGLGMLVEGLGERMGEGLDITYVSEADEEDGDGFGRFG